MDNHRNSDKKGGAELKAVLWFLVAIVMIIVGAAAWAWFDIQRFATHPAGTHDQQVVIDLTPGQSFDRFSTALMQNGIITSQKRFKLLARIKGDDKRIKAGEYGFTAAMTPLEVLDAVVNARVLLHRLTIPEGFTIEQIASEIGRLELSDPDAFKALARDGALIEALGLPGPSLEGYLFPDTYYLPRGTPAQAIVGKMVQNFHDQFSDDWHDRARERNLSVHQLVTLASMIEKEAGHPSERPLVASVFHNRMQRNMRLESDPTAVYGIEGFDGKITGRHVRADTPYNTYRIRGLPPGPIASPGRASLEAALYPAQTDYLFFVSRNDGTHHFSTTYAEHNAAVRKYQRGGRP